jgi:hypothetical protein
MQKDPQFLLDMLLSARIAVQYAAERSREDLDSDLPTLILSNTV